MQKKQQPQKFNKAVNKPNKPNKYNNKQKGKREQQGKFNKNPKNKQPAHNRDREGKQEMPTIQLMLKIPQQQRLTQSLNYFKKIRPFLASYMQKKEGSRVIQLLYKWGNTQMKSQTYKVVLQNWKQLIKSKYALHLISRVSNDFELPRIVEDAIILQNNKEGSMVLQNYIDKHPNSKQSLAIFKKFDSIKESQKQKGFQSQQVLHNLAMKSIQKGYYKNPISEHITRLAFPTMVQQERTKCIQFLLSVFQQLLCCEEGVKLFVQLYNYLDSKQKKNVVKNMKDKLMEIINKSRNSYVAVIKVITQTDDTVSIGNKLVSELLYPLSDQYQQQKQKNIIKNQEGIEEQMQNQNQKQEEVKNKKNQSQMAMQNQQTYKNSEDKTNYNKKILNILSSLLSNRNNNFNCLGKVEHTVSFTNCKKPQQTRKQQVRAYLYPQLVQYVTNQQNMNTFCTMPHESRVTLGLIKSMQADGSELLKSLSTKIIKHFIQDLQSKKVKNSKTVQISKSIVANNFGSKLLKNIILLNQSYIQKYCDKLSQIFKYNLQESLHSNASFVITALVQKGRSELIEQIRKNKIDVSKSKASDFYQAKLNNNNKVDGIPAKGQKSKQNK